MPSLFKQRLIGLLFMIAGSACTAWMWHSALTEGRHEFKTDLIFPIMAVMGVGQMLFPIDGEALKAKYGVDKPESLKQYPLSWFFVAATALAAGFGNVYLMSQTWIAP